jgi:D-3-phosphoglycerate dehydrogenase
MPQPTSFPKDKIKVLLLEGLHPSGVGRLREERYAVTAHKRAMDESELAEAIADVHLLGIRSKTLITKRVLDKARRLLAVGAFCIGTNQIDTDAARGRGVPVFNAPYSNTRSVAELVIGLLIALFRGLHDKVRAAHDGVWIKSAQGSVEVRGKTLGIVGYGHIGQQVSVLAEAMGMRVLYYDIVDKLGMGNAMRMPDMRSLLEQADAVTLHIPGGRDNEGLIDSPALAHMKKGAHLVNTSRGTVVDIPALCEALRSGRLGGAAIDVFPQEPKSIRESFTSPLQHMPNVILTPHIGGSTLEAQRNIGLEVAGKLIRFTNNGSTDGAVNFPNVLLPELVDTHRLLHIHANVPGVLQQVNGVFADAGINVAAQYLRTLEDVGYLIVDVEKSTSRDVLRGLKQLPETIRVRALF